MAQFADKGSVTRGTFSAQSDYFATSGGSGECKVWHAKDTSLCTTMVGHLTKTHDVAFNPNVHQMESHSYGALASCSSDLTIKLWTFKQDQQFQKFITLTGTPPPIISRPRGQNKPHKVPPPGLRADFHLARPDLALLGRE